MSELPTKQKPFEKTTIAFVQPTLEIGGGETLLANLIRGLDKDAFRPVLCCLYGAGQLGEQLQAEGYETYCGLMSARYDARGIFNVASVLLRERPSILYVTNALLNMIVGRLAAFPARVPLSVIIFHSQDNLRDPFMRFSEKVNRWWSEKLLLPHFDRVIALSETHGKYLATSKHIPAGKIAVVYNGIDLRKFVRPVDTRAIRQSLRLPDSAKVVGVVANLWPWKTHDVFLRSAAVLLGTGLVDAYFVIAGDGPERDNLENMAQDLGIADHVRFMGTVDDVPALLKSIDLSVLSSAHEVFPLALLESMAAGCPVVATNVGSIPEIVENGLTGFLVPPGAPDQLAEAMLRVLTEPQLARKLGSEGRKRVEEKFTVEHMVSRTESLLLDLVDSVCQSPRAA